MSEETALELVLPARSAELPGGLAVRRALPRRQRRMVGPFVFVDQMGPAPLAADREVTVLPHPHIGLSTITYLFEGEGLHRDSLGTVQRILPGEVNWMTAGRGITHSERFERARREGGPLDGIQSWVALPVEAEETEPTFSHHDVDELPSFEEAGAAGRLIAGSLWGLSAPVNVHSPLFYVHWALESGASASLPAEYPERAVYVASGAVEVGARRFEAGQMLVLEPRAAVTLKAAEPSAILALGGEPVGPRFIEWNFVSSSQERIEQAKADWRAGRMKLPDLDNQEWIPLPPDPREPPNPMS